MIAIATKNILVCLAFLFLISDPALCQNSLDSIQIRKLNGADIFVYRGQKLKAKQLMRITRSDDEAFVVMRSAKTDLDIGNVFGFIGGALIGFPLGGALSGRPMNYGVLGVGVVLAAVSIGFTLQYKKTTKRAIGVYNQNLRKSSTSTHNIKLQFNRNRVSLSVRI